MIRYNRKGSTHRTGYIFEDGSMIIFTSNTRKEKRRAKKFLTKMFKMFKGEL